jgi:hypothetical protein
MNILPFTKNGYLAFANNTPSRVHGADVCQETTGMAQCSHQIEIRSLLIHWQGAIYPYIKHFKKNRPENVRSIEQMVRDHRRKKAGTDNTAFPL